MSQSPQIRTDLLSQSEQQNRFFLLVLLTFVSGFTDTAGFVLLFELFTAHITGNTVIAIADIVHRGGVGALTAVLTLPIFIVTVIVCTLAMDSAKRHWRHWALTLMITAETLLLGAFFAAALLLDPADSTPDGLPVIVVGGLGVIAMAVQNTIAGQLPKPSTVMTGNLTNMIIHAVRWVRALRTRDGALRDTAKNQMWILGPTLIAFTLGATLAGIGVVTIGYWSLLIPIPVSAAAAAFSLRQRRELHSEWTTQ